ncbi:MAG: efflux RND transporter permease subunit, partial [Hyphomicrobiaceae bacterium]|nr:efflux RND transporter permease subunit [Hyphomicrobiaceae bacterium]
MKLSHFFIVRPIFAAVVSLFITIIGAIAYWSLPLTQFPEIVPPTIVVTTQFPGASAQTVADTVATPLEQEINGVDGMLYMYSQSTSDGNLTLTVTFEIGTDLDKAQVLVQNRVATAVNRLPEEVRRVGVTTRKNSPDLLLVVHLYSPDSTYDQVYISNYGLLQVTDRLARVDGVGSVNMFGAREYSMRIWLDPERIAALGMTAEDVLAALRAQNVQVAGGALGEPPIATRSAFQVSLQLKGRLVQPSEFENIVLKSGADGRVVRVRDVGRVELGALNYLTYGYLDRQPAVVFVITQQPGSNALGTADAIRARMKEIARDFPKGLSYDIIYDPTEFIRVSIEALNITILEAIGLVVLVVLLFLQTWRASVIPVIAIPVSLIGTFAVMSALGFSINTLTLFGLVLAVGIVVDDAIVVVENVERRLSEGLSPIEAARATMTEVGGPVISIALVLSAVFIPTAFVGGITGQFYRQFAVTIATATVISAIVSLTLSPALSAILLKRHAAGAHQSLLMRPINAFFRAFNAAFDALARGHARLVRLAIRVRWLTLIIYAGLIGATAWLMTHLQVGFIPTLDRGVLIVSLQLPPGAALDRTDAVVRRAQEIILSTPGFVHTSGYAGRSGATFTNATNAGAIFAVMAPHAERATKGQTQEALAAELRKRLGVIQEARIIVIIPPPVRGVGSSGGFSMRLQDRAGLGTDRLAAAAFDLIAAANRTPGIIGTFTTFSTNTPQVYIDVDRVRAQMLKVPLSSIFETLRIYMGSAYVNDFNLFGRTYRVTAQADAIYRLNQENVKRLRVRNADGQMVPLGSVVTFREISGPERVPRYNLFPTVEINGRTAPGVSSGQGLEIMAALAKRTLPEGIGFEWTDLSFQEARVGRAGYYIFALSVLFVFLALAAQYESWSL